MSTEPDIEATLQLYNDITLESLIDFGGMQELPTHIRVAVQTYMRAVNLYEANKRLLPDGFHEAAMVLGRSIMSASLQLEAVATTNDDGRVALLMGAYDHSLMSQVALMTKAELWGIADDASAPKNAEATAVLESRRADVRKYLSRLGVKATRRFGSEHDLARKQGRLGEYWDHEYASEVTHGQEFTTPAVRKDAEGVYWFAVRHRDPKWISMAAAFALDAMLVARKAMTLILGVDELAAMLAFMARWDSLKGSSRASIAVEQRG